MPARESTYSYNDNDGLHIAFGDNGGFDAVVLRGGASARMYGDAGSLKEPERVSPLCSFGAMGDVEVKRFAKRVGAKNVSFFAVGDGTIADLGFFRIGGGRAGHSS